MLERLAIFRLTSPLNRLVLLQIFICTGFLATILRTRTFGLRNVLLAPLLVLRVQLLTAISIRAGRVFVWRLHLARRALTTVVAAVIRRCVSMVVRLRAARLV